MKMFAAFKQGSRVINRLSGSYYGEICNSSVLASRGNSLHRSSNSFECFSHCTVYPQHCNTSLGAVQMLKTRKAAREVYPVGNVMKSFHQGVIKTNFHTNSCLNNKHDDYQREEKRNANILIGMSVIFIVSVYWCYSLIDVGEYDRPSVDKS